jgi:glycosyltransferase involved in cell wall biosynthesis
MDATLCLIKPGFASIASCPTKLGESLAVGAPVVVNPGIGDVEDILLDSEVGVSWNLQANSVRAAAERLVALVDDPSVAERARRTAASVFDLRCAIDVYARLYQGLLETAAPSVEDAFELPVRRRASPPRLASDTPRQ